MNTEIDTDNIEATAKRIVEREVIYCVSTLIYELSQICTMHDAFAEYYDDLVFDAWTTAPDYKEALTQNGCDKSHNHIGDIVWQDTDTGDVYVGNAQEACEAFNIDADDYRREVFEHWIVSHWLADKLEQHGETVLHDMLGLDRIWCRTTTGQSIAIDSVICDIAKETLQQ